MVRLALAAAALLAAAPAQAMDVWMWGVGAHVGTNIIPGHFPSLFSKAVRGDDLSSIDKFRDDLIFGVEGMYYVDKNSRMSLSGGLTFAPRYFDRNVLLSYDYVFKTGAMDLLAGGGLGVGLQRWLGDGQARLVIPYYPFRVQASAMIRDEHLAWQLTIFGQYDVPSSQAFTDSTGADVDSHGGIYGTMGAQVSMYYGDFKPPRRKPD